MGVPGPAVQAADHSMLGIARTSSLRLGVPECLRTNTKRAPSDVCATAWRLSKGAARCWAAPDAVVTEDRGAGRRADER